MKIRLLLKECSILNRFVIYSYPRGNKRHVSDSSSDKTKLFNPFGKRAFKDSNEKDSRIANRICISIIGNGALGQPRCLALFTEFRGFIFNCGAGVGRICREYEVNICEIRHVFITQKTWHNLSGLHDVYLTNSVFGVPKMTLYGPPGIEHFTSLVSSYKSNIVMRKKSAYVDDNMEINSIPVQPSRSLGPFRGNDGIALSYVCKIFKRLGDFNPEKCVDLGVPFGNHLLKLKNGEDVILPSGRKIYSADVLDDSYPAITLLIVDCPSEAFLDPFVNQEQFYEYQLPKDCAVDVSYVFHFSPPHVIKSTKYQNWMQRFHQDTQHFILNSSTASECSEAIFQTQNVLNLLHPEIFKLLPDVKIESQHSTVSNEVIHPPPMLQIYLRPEKKVSWDNVFGYKSYDFSQIREELPDFNHELSKLESLVSQEHLSEENEKYPEVIFLGTGSALPTAFRNVSSILVNIDSHKSILLDCGEATFGQLVRYFGNSNIVSALQKISCVFISHLHTDHYMGLFEFIKARNEAFEQSNTPCQPLALIMPFKIQEILKRFYDLFEPFQSVRIFSCKYLGSNSNNQIELSNFLGNVKLITVPVKHCPDAYGVVLQLGSCWKIVYSGDTAPCQKLVEAGQNCTLLIHEASIEDNLVNESTMKRHTTPAEVVDVAERMNAEYTIMTHFSKRYLAVPTFTVQNNLRIGCAFDFMKVQLHELPLIPLFLPALKCLFQDHLRDRLDKSSGVVQFENVFLKTYRSLKLS